MGDRLPWWWWAAWGGALFLGMLIEYTKQFVSWLAEMLVRRWWEK